MTLTDSQKSGIVFTVLFHTAILLMLLFWGFVTPAPPVEEEGFLVDFGNSTTGLGIEEPSAVQGDEGAAASKKTEPDHQAANEPRIKQKTDASNDDDVVTQDYEKAEAIAVARKKAINEKKVKLAEEKRIKDQELKNQKDELIAKERQETEDKRIQLEKDKKIGLINSRVKNAFGGGKTDNGSQSTSQGNTYGGGNQGSPDGTPGTNQYGGHSGDGQGPSYSLSGRSARSLPKPTFPGNESGTVVVEVTVNNYGKVTKALPGIKGSNTVDPSLLEAAKKAAMAATFNSDTNAPAFQKGTITYHFIIQ